MFLWKFLAEHILLDRLQNIKHIYICILCVRKYHSFIFDTIFYRIVYYISEEWLDIELCKKLEQLAFYFFKEKSKIT